jgi:hypothetical protein
VSDHNPTPERLDLLKRVIAEVRSLLAAGKFDPVQGLYLTHLTPQEGCEACAIGSLFLGYFQVKGVREDRLGEKQGGKLRWTSWVYQAAYPDDTDPPDRLERYKLLSDLLPIHEEDGALLEGLYMDVFKVFIPDATWESYPEEKQLCLEEVERVFDRLFYNIEKLSLTLSFLETSLTTPDHRIDWTWRPDGNPHT